MDANTKTVGAYFWARGGELGKLIHEKDWSKTPLGPIESWPQSLKTAVGIMLTSRQPIWIGWGESLIYLYNDPYKSIIGGKHPRMLGQPTAVVWREIWDVIGPMLRTAMSGDAGTYVESQLLIMERHGFREETYYTFSYSPIPDDDGSPGGIICANTDDTQRTIGERQMALLRDLAARTAANSRTWEEACERSAEAMGSNNRDLPFAMIYLAKADRPELALAGACGIAPGHPAAPQTVSLENPGPWPFVQALATREMIVVDDLSSILDAPFPTGGWEEPPVKAVLLPISASGAAGRGGVLVVGLNPFRLFDDGYKNFLNLIAGQISASIASAQAYEEERMRAEALAEVDRAKTAFFSNVSHEFRTPLTLILGPAEEILSGSAGETNEIQRAHLTTLHHNAVRLQKLVNTLLDYARVEAGRLQANYEPVDIGPVTRELASTFCSAVHRAGLLYVVNCPAIEERVFIDRDMWEKIVLNLLSNALKFTFKGTIEVSLAADADHVALTVRDTGVGIPQEELPRLFERFHRVHGSRARTQEGSGIGLALVQELVKLHGGALQVASVVGSGTTFTVHVPKGSAHLPKDRIGAPRALGSTALGAAPFVEEALRWLPEDNQRQMIALPVGASSVVDALSLKSPAAERILIADDNLEMRNYLKRLLETRWNVAPVQDGAEALQVAREQRPDLVLSDVMMPDLDGFALLRALRDDDRTKTIPVILLSARAGEEAYIEAMNAGADDYIVKPFGARELIARVKALLEVTRVRRESERRVAGVLESITDGFQVFDRDWRLIYMNGEAKRTFADHGIDPEWALGKHLWDELFPEDKDSEAAVQQRRVMRDRVHASFEKYYAPWQRWYAVRAYPLPEGGVANYFQDITEYKEAESAKARLAAIIESSEDAIISKDLNGIITSWNYAAELLFGYRAEEMIHQPGSILIPAERLDEEPHILDRIRRGERIEHYETVRRRKNGMLLDISLSVSPIIDDTGRIIGASKIARDITERKRGEMLLHEQNKMLEVIASGRPIAECLQELCATVPRLNPRARAAVLLANSDVTSFVDCVTSGISDSFSQGVIGTPIGECAAGTCGAALHIKAPVTCADIAADTRWTEPWRALCLASGVRACHSTPIRGADGTMQGSFILCFDQPSMPGEWDRRLAEFGVRIAGIALTREEASAALRQSEQRFRTMADSSPIMIWMTDENGQTIFLNQVYSDYFGVASEEAANFDWHESVHPDDRQRYVESFRAALAKGERFYERARLRRHDGQWRWFEARAAPIFDTFGKLVAYIGSSPDITEIYESQRALRELDQRKDEFLANMSHEIRSPLTGIMGYADILLGKLKDPEDIEYLKTIKESGDYLIEIVNDILDLSKIEAGKLVLNTEDVPLYSVLAEVQSLMAVRAKEKGLSLGLRYEGTLPESVHTDRTRLRQILINLVSNGVKFTERGRVDIVARVVDSSLQLEVIDTGIGIAPEHEKILFQPFTQADATSTRHYGGTGLGLTITKRLVEMLGGSISFESVHGEGSTFRILIPLGTAGRAYSKPRKLPGRNAVVAPDGLLHDKRVLVVDDREEICYLVSRYIRDAGGRPAEAADGESALEAIAGAADNDPFDAMILDIHMPGMDGYEVARTLRRTGFSAPIIALTAGAMVGDREKCLQAGCNDYLTKPIDRQKLVQLLAQHTENRMGARNGSGTNRRVLLVDDSQSACKFLTLFLEKRGYEVRTAYDGESAIAMAQDFRPAAILMDIRLPDMDGFQLLEHLKKIDSVSDSRFIAVSGYCDTERQGDFDYFLEKPLDTARLETLLREVN